MTANTRASRKKKGVNLAPKSLSNSQENKIFTLGKPKRSTRLRKGKPASKSRTGKKPIVKIWHGKNEYIYEPKANHMRGMKMNINKIFMMIFLSFVLALAGCQREGTDDKTGQQGTSGTERSGAGMGSTTQGAESSQPGTATEPGSTGGMGTSPGAAGTSPGATGTSPGTTGAAPGATGTSPGSVETPLEKTGEYMDDSVITAKIKQDILGDPLLKSSQISVTTENGVVKLSGTVDSQQSIDRVKAIAQSVTDVKAVESELAIK
jgi:hyperosmotically inducible protein